MDYKSFIWMSIAKNSQYINYAYDLSSRMQFCQYKLLFRNFRKYAPYSLIRIFVGPQSI